MLGHCTYCDALRLPLLLKIPDLRYLEGSHVVHGDDWLAPLRFRIRQGEWFFPIQHGPGLGELNILVFQDLGNLPVPTTYLGEPWIVLFRDVWMFSNSFAHGRA